MKGKNQLLTGMTGSFENLTAVQSKDGDVILKGKITQMTNPNTEGQQFTRTRFGQVVTAVAAIHNTGKPQFKRNSPHVSLYSSQVSGFMTTALTLDPFTIDDLFVNTDFTKGDLYSLSASVNVGGSQDNGDGTWDVEIEWPYDPESLSQDGTDLVFLFWVNTDKYDYNLIDLNQVRSDGSATPTIAVPSAGNTYLVCYARNESDTEWSTAKAIGKLTSAGVLTAI